MVWSIFDGFSGRQDAPVRRGADDAYRMSRVIEEIIGSSLKRDSQLDDEEGRRMLILAN